MVSQGHRTQSTDALSGSSCSCPVDFPAIADGVGGPETFPVLVADEPGAADAGEPHADDNATTDDVTAEDRARSRSIATRFVRIPKLRSMCTGIRLAMTAVFDMTHSSLETGGARWGAASVC